MNLIERSLNLGSVRAEWVKFWTLRSNRILATFAILFVPINTVLLSASLRQRSEDVDVAMRTPSIGSIAYLDSVLWLQLVIAVIAALAASQENDGRLGISFLAIPSRVPVLLAKIGVVCGVAFAIGLLGSFMGQSLPIALLADSTIVYSFDAIKALALATAAGLYLAGIAAISLSIAVLLQNLVLAILVPLASFTIIPALISSFGGKYGEQIAAYFPTIAGRTAITSIENYAGLNGTGGLIVLGLWAFSCVCMAGFSYKLRDVG